MERQQLLERYDLEHRIDIDYPEACKEQLPGLVRFVRPAPGMNLINYSRLTPERLDAAIAEQVDYFRQFDQPFEWIVCEHDQPAELGERLAAAGFVPDDPAAVMLLDLDAVPAVLQRPPAADVRLLTDRRQLDQVIHIEETVWGGSFAWMHGRIGGHMEIPGFIEIYVAYVDNQPACAGWIYFYPRSKFAGLWGGSTLPALRGRGLYTAVLAARVQSAVRRGYRWLLIEAGPMSRPIVARHGFELLTHTTAYGWPRQ